MASYERAIILEPDNPDHHAGRARALSNLANLLATLGPSSEQALSRAEEALEAYESAIAMAPDDLELQLEKTSVLTLLATLESWLPSGARLMRAIEDLDRLVKVSPSGDVSLRRMATMIHLASLKSRLGHYEEALDTYMQVLQEAESEDIARPTAHIRGEVHARLGQMYMTMGLRQAAETNLGKALLVYSHILVDEPDEFVASCKRADCFQLLGDVQTGFASIGSVLESFGQAISIYEHLLITHSDKPNLRFGKGQTLAKIGELHHSMGESKLAVLSLRAAKEEVDKAVGAPVGEAARSSLLDEIDHVIAVCEPPPGGV